MKKCINCGIKVAPKSVRCRKCSNQHKAKDQEVKIFIPEKFLSRGKISNSTHMSCMGEV